MEDLLGSTDVFSSSSKRKLVVLSGPNADERSAALRLRSYEVTGIELRFGLEVEAESARKSGDGEV